MKRKPVRGRIAMRPASDRRLRVISVGALAVSSTIELLQVLPAPFALMHSAGEIVRNLGYSVLRITCSTISLPSFRNVAMPPVDRSPTYGAADGDRIT